SPLTSAAAAVSALARDQERMLSLPACGGAVFAVAGDVEDRAEIVLQSEGLEDELFVARVMLAGGQGGKRSLSLEEHLVRMHRCVPAHRFARQTRRCLIALRSSSSSLSVAFIFSRLKPSISSPLTSSYFPPVPSSQSRTWSMAALAADAAEDRPRASMTAAPRLPTVGRKISRYHFSSPTTSGAGRPAMVANR